ncbi:RHS repeat-associated core domain-containing protein, partial [Chitiniphilus shinanonensis]|uniref:RHS repeat-associated core domain-containing protein n=1 Tax=Chitiniphilus shinanonensis TaxID=553088 RepID=UPI0033413648
KPFEDKIGLSYYGARWYDPTLGRFMAMDPVDWVAGNPVHSFNRYGYANSNPLRYIDPDGRFAAGTAEQALGPHAAMLGATGQSCSACVGGAFDATVAEWERGGLEPEVGPWEFVFAGAVKYGPQLVSILSKLAKERKNNKEKENEGSGVPFDPTGRRVQEGVNPKSLKPQKDLSKLDKGRLRRVEENARDQSIEVTRDGVIQQGHHRVRNAIDNGRSVDVKVIN